MYFLLLLLWIAYNGRLTFEVLAIGVVVCGGLYWFMCSFMNYNWKKDINIIKKTPKFIKFGFIVMWEILKANTLVLKSIFLFSKEFDPQIVNFKTNLKNKSTQVTLANCITLTPGTYTLKLENGNFTVYGIGKKSVENIENSIYVKKLKEFEV